MSASTVLYYYGTYQNVVIQTFIKHEPYEINKCSECGNDYIVVNEKKNRIID